MLDLILLAIVLAVFAAGFWCGAKFRTVAGLKAVIAGWFK